MRNPSPSSARPSVICQLGIDRNRPPTRLRSPVPGMVGQACAGRRRSAIASDQRRAQDDRPRGAARGGPGDRSPCSSSTALGGAAGADAPGPGSAEPTGAPGSGAAPPSPQPGGCGPAGAGCGPKRSGGVAPMSCIQAALESLDVDPERVAERLVVGAALAVRADQLHERIPAVGPDQVVDALTRSRRRRGRTARTCAGTGPRSRRAG